MLRQQIPIPKTKPKQILQNNKKTIIYHENKKLNELVILVKQSLL
jgi:hypothetical protein